MKKISFYFGVFFFALLLNMSVKAQLLMEENFIFTSGVPLVAGAIASSDNASTSTTGWITISNTTSSATNAFNISAEGLVYPGYIGSGIGKALTVIDNAGQDVFKTYSTSNTVPTAGAAFPGPKTIYAAFMINVPAEDKSGNEFSLAVCKYSNSAADNNYMGRLFVKVTGTNVQFGISKSTTPSPFPANFYSSNYATNTTYLLVIKYTMKDLNGANATEEAGKYDDLVDLYVNPTIGGTEPTTATLHYENAADKDAYRYGTSAVIGGAAAFYFRTPTATGSIPAATFDGIRVATTWADAVKAGTTTGVADIINNQAYKVYSNYNQKTVNVDMTEDIFNQYQIFSVTGQKMAEKKINQRNFALDVSTFNSGIYILSLKGNLGTRSAKFIIP